MNINKILIGSVTFGLAILLAAGGAQAQRGGGGGFNPGGGMGGFGGGGGGMVISGPDNVANMSVSAVADERSNSVIVSAPDELWDQVEDLIRQVDNILQRSPEYEVFPLRYADATEMANTIENIFNETGGGGRGGNFRMGGSSGMTIEIETTAIADTRTNSVLVSADKDKLPDIAAMIASLDKDPSRDKQIYTYTIENSDVETVTALIQEIISAGSSSGNARGNTRGNTAFGQRGGGTTTGFGGGGGGGTSGFGGGGTTARGGGR